MKKVLILGAYGKIARIVEKRLLDNPDYQLTLVLRHACRLDSLKNHNNVTVIEGDVSDKSLLTKVIADQDVVYANLNGQMERWAQNIVFSMQQNSV
ncbi:MAG TPA: NAD(P)H-binding protein, partial [Companilactobacillus farciminis]|nr:NAD(P)H-binding protein [Companilactobacillus farciminis]